MARIHQLRPKARRMRKTADAAHYVLRLFTTGTTPRSTRALRNLSEICETNLKGRYHLEVIDICQEPGRATESGRYDPLLQRSIRSLNRVSA